MVISMPRHQYVNDNGRPSLQFDFSYQIMKGFTLNSCYQQPNSFMWHLDPVSNLLPPIVNKNPLPNGNYRIRSFIGSYVLMTPKGENGRPYVRKQVQDNNAQEVSCRTLPFLLIKVLCSLSFSVVCAAPIEWLVYNQEHWNATIFSWSCFQSRGRGSSYWSISCFWRHSVRV